MSRRSKILDLFRLPPSQEDRIILLICLGVALLFWLIVKLDGTYPKQMEVNLEYLLSEQEAFVELPTRKAQATVKGEGWTLIQPNPDLSLQIDLTTTNQKYINSSFLVSEIEQKLRFQNLTIDRLVPEYITLNIEEKISKKVPITLRDSLSYAEEHYLEDDILISPDSVLISGPISVVNALEEWPTKIIRKENLDATIQDTLELRKDKKGILTLEPVAVSITIPVERYTEKSFFVPVTVEHDFDSLKIFPNKIQLHVTVGLNDYNDISAEDFVLEADMKTATRTGDNNTAPLLITKRPTSVRSVHFSPKAIEFLIVELEEEEEIKEQ